MKAFHEQATAAGFQHVLRRVACTLHALCVTLLDISHICIVQRHTLLHAGKAWWDQFLQSSFHKMPAQSPQVRRAGPSGPFVGCVTQCEEGCVRRCVSRCEGCVRAGEEAWAAWTLGALEHAAVAPCVCNHGGMRFSIGNGSLQHMLCTTTYTVFLLRACGDVFLCVCARCTSGICYCQVSTTLQIATGPAHTIN